MIHVNLLCDNDYLVLLIVINNYCRHALLSVFMHECMYDLCIVCIVQDQFPCGTIK